MTTLKARVLPALPAAVVGVAPITASVANGILTIGTISGQYNFPVTQNPSDNPNTLDDYEEGTFTPVLTFGGGSTGITYSTQIGKYTKIGNVVFGWINIMLTSKGSSVGSAVVAGLPFTPAAMAACAFQINNMAASVATQAQGTILSGDTTITPQRMATGAATNMADTDFTNTSVLRIAFSYPV